MQESFSYFLSLKKHVPSPPLTKKIEHYWQLLRRSVSLVVESIPCDRYLIKSVQSETLFSEIGHKMTSFDWRRGGGGRAQNQSQYELGTETRFYRISKRDSIWHQKKTWQLSKSCLYEKIISYLQQRISNCKDENDSFQSEKNQHSRPTVYLHIQQTLLALRHK